MNNYYPLVLPKLFMRLHMTEIFKKQFPRVTSCYTSICFVKTKHSLKLKQWQHNNTIITPLNSWSFHCAVCIQVTSTTIFTELNQRAASSRAEVLKSRETATVALKEKKRKEKENWSAFILFSIYSLCELLSWFK